MRTILGLTTESRADHVSHNAIVVLVVLIFMDRTVNQMVFMR